MRVCCCVASTTTVPDSLRRVIRVHVVRVLCAGSFDPVTISHVDLIHRARDLFGSVLACVAINPAKPGTSPPAERVRLLSLATEHLSDVAITSYAGLTVDLCRAEGISVIVRGVRSQTDWAYEGALADANRAVGSVETVCLPCRPDQRAISSSLARELSSQSRRAAGLLPFAVLSAMGLTPGSQRDD